MVDIYGIDKQYALRHDCIYNIENTDLEIGVSGISYIYFHLLIHIDVPAGLAHCECYTSTCNRILTGVTVLCP